MARIVELETEIEQGDFKVDPEKKYSAEEQFNLFLDRWQKEHRDYVQQADKQDQYFQGEQWNEKDRKKLEDEGRPVVTTNLILSTINTFMGEQISRRVDLQYRAHKNASKDEAHALSNLAMAILDSNQYDWLETDMVEDGVIRDRGYLNFRVSFDDDIQGDIEIKHIHPSNVVLEPFTVDYDPKEWPGVMFSEWYSMEELSARFGEDRRKELEQSINLFNTLGSESLLFEGGATEQIEDLEVWQRPLVYTKEHADTVKSVRVIDRQFYRNTEIFVLINPETLEQEELPPGTKKDRAERVAQVTGFYLRKKLARRLYWRVTADRVLLWEGWSPYKTPTIVPYFPYFRNGKTFGIVKNLLSPQEQHNKVASQELHIVNSTANGGWKVKRNALKNMTTDELARDGSKTGVVLELDEIGNAEKIDPNQVPTGITHIKTATQLAVRDIAGFSDAFVGADSQEVSGVALKSRVDRGQVQIQKPMDNLSRTRYLVGRKLLELIQRFYTDARIVTIVDYAQPGFPTTDMPINMPQEDGSILNDFTRGVYDVNVATMPARNSYDDAQFAEILNMISVGIPIPGYHAVRYSNLQQKDAMAEEMKMMAGLQAPTPEEQQMQQMQQQLALQDMQVSIMEKEARVRELMSKVTLNEAKAQNELTEEERELRRLMVELQKEREAFRIRLQLAQMQGIQNLDQKDMDIRGDLLKEAMKSGVATNAQAR